MKPLCLILLALLLVCIPSWGCGQTGYEKTAAVTLLEKLIAALNTRDETKRRSFLEAHATTDVPIDERIQRMKNFAEQGSPFRLESVPVVTANEVKAEIVDRENVRLNITLATTGGTSPKFKAMRAMPAGANGRPNKLIEDWKDIHDLARKIADKSKAPAMGITFIRDGKVESTAVGVRETGAKAPVAADEPWNIGSIGKSLCTTIIGKLIEQGKLNWEQTLGETLKDIPMQSGYTSVTIEQLMQHRGGIPQDMDFRRERVERIAGDAKTPTAIRARYIRDILSREPMGKPGKQFAYSNAGYALLGHIAERVTGKSYEQLVRDIIFKPLGLKHSYTGTDTLPDARPSGHINHMGELTPANMGGALEFMVAPAGGGLFMSTADLAKFGAEHLKGLRGKDGLLKAATVVRLHQGISEGEGELLYACGWGIEPNPGTEPFHGHNGSNGTFRAQLAIFPKSNLVVASIVNCGGEREPAPGLEAVQAVAARFAKE